jgi:aspartate racemase
MRTIGMLGGMSWQSTAEYYRLANELVADRLGGLHSAEILLHSLDFARVERLQVSGDWEQAARLLTAAARTLEDAGADLLLLCTNTMHKVADDVEAGISVPLVHLVDVTSRAVAAAGLARVGLLGTDFTMSQDFYRDRFRLHGPDLLVPDERDRATVHRIIYDELCRGIVSETSRRAYQDVIARLVDRGAEGVVLGCTEIELLVEQRHSPVPVFATTRLHVEAAVDLALGDATPAARPPATRPPTG